VARIPAYFVKNPTLVKVEPGYYYLTTGAFAKTDKHITITSKDDLKNTRLASCVVLPTRKQQQKVWLVCR
jgi:hypothetical protein